MRSGIRIFLGSQSRYVPAAFVLAVSLALGPAPGAANDVSEALRLWKFTYHMEAAAYGIQYMSKDLLESSSRQLETATNNTVIGKSDGRICLDAATELSAYFDDAAKTVSSQNRKQIRIRYEAARAGCMRALGADPAQYPLGWP